MRKNIYTSSNPNNSDIDEALKDVKPIISDDINSRLVDIPTIEEINATINEMAPWKSPGPDGFPAGFFRDNWKEISKEVIDHKNAKNGFMTINLDLSKAFDRLEWSFILPVFKKLGFYDEWCQIIEQCISTVSYSILVNGSPGEVFFPTRGIRQGDCLSPYIFIICMEVLSQLILKGEALNLIQGFKIRKDSPYISHLFFADDCMLFSKAFLMYARNLMKIINVFAKASSQAINFEKSGFFTSSKMHHKHKKLLSKDLGMKFMSSSEKYLGTPLFVNRDKTKSFQFLIDKFYSRLGNTKKSSLNVAGRTVVTKHVLSSLAVYHMSCFPFPKKITYKIDSIQRIFWWSKKDPKRAAYFRSWGDIGKDKRCGGLGVRSTYATNRVFIAKLGWRIIQNPDLLISKFLKDKYFINHNLLEIDNAADSNSWIWKGIVNSLIFLRSNIVFKINDGNDTRIWDSVWLPGTSSPPVSLNPNYDEFNLVSELIDKQSGTWNIDLSNSMFEPEYVVRIRTIKINLLLKDQIMWAHMKDGSSTIKFAYRVYQNEVSNGEEALFRKKVWNLNCLPKIKFFMWKIFAHMLPVNALLKNYNPAIDESCHLCNADVETVTHLFFHCPVATHIWFGLSLQRLVSLNLDWPEDFFLEWFDDRLGQSPFVVDWPSLGAIIMWCIWKFRCDVVFSRIAINMDKIILDTKRMVNTYIVIPKKVQKASIEVKIPIDLVDHCLFIDGSFKDFNATALYLTISWAMEINLSKVLFINDCLQVVNFVNGSGVSIEWRCKDILLDCKSLLLSWNNFKVSKNKLAHKLARRARKYCLKNVWVSFPSFLNNVVRKEPILNVCNSLLS
ncbi:uncharacterized protein LOC113344348 [Papaver somniferum]|uniref:uncharacterized protein LOC113344348 n=1 Tax=Papaver somniferum TaxID=3469 RepID=UPI000E7010AF|nr:uncharacterized protein LOC113344348 [Papaver somniferum]